MAIWGNGTSESDPVYFDTWEDFQTALSISNYTYLEFATKDINNNYIPLENRVMDLRKKGWFSGAAIRIQGKTKIKGNGWTILGMSIMNGSVINESNVTVQDLIIKNMYIYANDGSSIFHVHGGTSTFSNCKFSGVFDSSNNNTITVFNLGSNYGSSSTGRIYIERCSFNFKIHNYIYLLGYYAGPPTFDNCLFNFTSSDYGTRFLINPNKTTHTSYYWAIYRFCKFSGGLIIRDYEQTPNLICINSNTAFCVFDIDVRYLTEPSSNPVLISYNGSITNSTSVINKDKIHLPEGIDFSVPSCVAKCSASDMVNKSYLESVYFLVGDEPVDT